MCNAPGSVILDESMMTVLLYVKNKNIEESSESDAGGPGTPEA